MPVVIIKRNPKPTMAQPQLRKCKLCSNSYLYPCDGKNTKCMSRRWVIERRAGKQPSLPRG